MLAGVCPNHAAWGMICDSRMPKKKQHEDSCQACSCLHLALRDIEHRPGPRPCGRGQVMRLPNPDPIEVLYRSAGRNNKHIGYMPELMILVKGLLETSKGRRAESFFFAASSDVEAYKYPPGPHGSRFGKGPFQGPCHPLRGLQSHMHHNVTQLVHQARLSLTDAFRLRLHKTRITWTKRGPSL